MTMNFRALTQNLSKKLGEPLPGIEAHLKMATDDRMKWIRKNQTVTNARKSSVLILLFEEKSVLHTILIRRTDYGGIHSGQVSFPGGQYEEKDGDLIETALRESEEEIGLQRDSLEILGVLSTIYIPPSNFNVLPVVACTRKRMTLSPDPSEVDSIIRIPITDLMSAENCREIDIPVHQSIVRAPAFIFGNTVVWGATAMIISELLELLSPLMSE